MPNTHTLLALCFDLGDTIMDEGTELKDAAGTTLEADLVPGMARLLRDLRTQGHTLAIVADSRPNTPPNVLRRHGLLGLFDTLSISEVIGVSKPEPQMFTSALDALGIPATDYNRVVMVGNNLERDIAGANRLGLISVFFHWSERRRTTPETEDEAPDYTVRSAQELRALLADLDHPSPSSGPRQTATPLRRQDAVSPPRNDMTDNHHIEIVCHKGANKVAPENTYAAAQQCIDWGAGTVEIDVWTSRDGELVLIHDDTVDRTTDGSGHVIAHTAAELARLDAGSWFSPAFAGERIPVLGEFLAWIRGRARLFLDVKFAHPQQLLDLLAKTGMHDECFIWSGSDAWMELLHGLDPSMALKVNVSTPKDVAAAHKTFGARIVEVSLAAMSDELLEACRERGIKTMIYEKEPAAFPDVIRWQPDMVNLDHADLFLQAVKKLATADPNVQTFERSNVTTRRV